MANQQAKQVANRVSENRRTPVAALRKSVSSSNVKFDNLTPTPKAANKRLRKIRTSLYSLGKEADTLRALRDSQGITKAKSALRKLDNLSSNLIRVIEDSGFIFEISSSEDSIIWKPVNGDISSSRLASFSKKLEASLDSIKLHLSDNVRAPYYLTFAL